MMYAADPTWTEKEKEAERERERAEKSFRHEAALFEPEWKGKGLEPGLFIWRIEHFNVVPVPKDTYGQFHEGDSYIVLHTEKPDPDSEKLAHHIYFWLGKETSIDEQGTAAYKTVELDDYFHHEGHEYRETQIKEDECGEFEQDEGGESEQFKALFPDGINYLPGGCPSGFRHVAPEGHHIKLFQVRKHRGQCKTIQVPLSTAILNPRDSYILDGEHAVYVLDGPNADHKEKFAAAEAADAIVSEREGRVHVTHDINDAFWNALDGEKPSWACEEQAPSTPPRLNPVVGQNSGEKSKSSHEGPYSYEALKAKDPPLGVSPDAREQALSDANFKEVFAMSKEEFSELPRWKQQSKKKEKGLF